MKALYLTSTQKVVATRAAENYANKKMADIAKRAQYGVFVAMLNAGIPPETINRVIDCLAETKDDYAAYREEGCADRAFYMALREHGINVTLPTEEL